MACLLFVWVSAFPLFFRDVYKKERKAALCECKVMTFLYGVQYPNVGIFCVFVVYIYVFMRLFLVICVNLSGVKRFFVGTIHGL